MTELNLQQAAPPVLFEELRTGSGRRIGIAILNVEKTLNAISLEMVDLLDHQLRAWASDPHIALVMMQAAGEKAFYAGGDFYLVHTYPKPILARENGIVIGGGIGLMADDAGDYDWSVS